MYISETEYRKIQTVMPIVCVDLLIIFNGRCLLLKRSCEPVRGQYWFPGGRIFKMETIQKAVTRKAKEEVGLDCTFQEIVSVEETIFEKTDKMHTDIHTVNICCKLTTLSVRDLNIDEHHTEYVWVSFEDIAKYNLHRSVIEPLKKCFQLNEERELM